MIIDDDVFEKFVKPLISIGLDTVENTKLYYDTLNSYQGSLFIKENGLGTCQFNFLLDILNNQDLTKCPQCGSYNDNIECPIIRCDICDHEWSVKTDHSNEVCNACVAFKTDKCDKTPNKH